MFRALLLLFAVLMTAPASGSNDVALLLDGGLSLTLHAMTIIRFSLLYPIN